MLAAKGYPVIVPYLRGYGTTRFLSSETFRNGQQSVVAVDIIALMDVLGIEQAIVAGFDWGARTANIMAALWPERCNAMVAVSGYLITSLEANLQPFCRAHLEDRLAAEFMGIPATGNSFKAGGIIISRVENGLWREDDVCWDQLGMLQQLCEVTVVVDVTLLYVPHSAFTLDGRTASVHAMPALCRKGAQRGSCR